MLSLESLSQKARIELALAAEDEHLTDRKLGQMLRLPPAHRQKPLSDNSSLRTCPRTSSGWRGGSRRS
jgi:hypothetical protein